MRTHKIAMAKMAIRNIKKTRRYNPNRKTRASAGGVFGFVSVGFELLGGRRKVETKDGNENRKAKPKTERIKRRAANWQTVATSGGIDGKAWQTVADASGGTVAESGQKRAANSSLLRWMAARPYHWPTIARTRR